MTTDEREASARDLGRLEGRVESLEARLDRTDAEAAKRWDEVDAKLSRILTRIDGWSGAQRVIVLFSSSILGVIGWLLAQWWPHLTGGKP